MSPRCQCLYEVEHNLPRTKFCLVACGEQFEIIAERMLKEKSAQIDKDKKEIKPLTRKS